MCSSGDGELDPASNFDRDREEILFGRSGSGDQQDGRRLPVELTYQSMIVQGLASR